MRDTTPHRLRPATEAPVKQQCLREMLTDAPPVDYIWEAFGGTGVAAQVFREHYPTAQIVACEIDEECVVAYNELNVGLCLKRDAFEYKVEPPCELWGASLDYNRFTLLDLQGRRAGWEAKCGLISMVVGLRPTWIHLTDTACYYLSFHYGTYGLSRPSLSEYVDVLSRTLDRAYGYRVTAYRNRRTSAYLLLEPTK